MDKQKLEALLTELHTELGRAEVIDEDSRSSLRQLAQEIQEILRRTEAERTAQVRPVLARLNDAVIQFEGTHPTLALAITQVINGLVDIGV